jgi:ABC-type sugar transport system substrate-binding protein
VVVTTTIPGAHEAGAPRATVALITNQSPGDTLWDLVRRGAEANSYARMMTFDTNAGVVDAIKNGLTEWAIDQQPFLQGYLALADPP